MDSSPGKPESNRKIADILHDHGDDLSRVREVDHWAYFPSDEARAAFIANCTPLGMTVARKMEPDEHSAQFGLMFFHVDAPNTRLMDDLTARLIAFAQAVGGEYDGWETQILD
ncbi:MAG: ribonuclease E inhibitor RraB [Rhizomicrobium sp.]